MKHETKEALMVGLYGSLTGLIAYAGIILAKWIVQGGSIASVF